jgi:hypothetical protein
MLMMMMMSVEVSTTWIHSSAGNVFGGRVDFQLQKVRLVVRLVLPSLLLSLLLLVS